MHQYKFSVKNSSSDDKDEDEAIVVELMRKNCEKTKGEDKGNVTIGFDIFKVR